MFVLYQVNKNAVHFHARLDMVVQHFSQVNEVSDDRYDIRAVFL